MNASSRPHAPRDVLKLCVAFLGELNGPEGFIPGTDAASADIRRRARDLHGVAHRALSTLDCYILDALKRCVSFLAELNGQRFIERDDDASIDMRNRSRELQGLGFGAVDHADPDYYGRGSV